MDHRGENNSCYLGRGQKWNSKSLSKYLGGVLKVWSPGAGFWNIIIITIIINGKAPLFCTWLILPYKDSQWVCWKRAEQIFRGAERETGIILCFCIFVLFIMLLSCCGVLCHGKMSSVGYQLVLKQGEIFKQISGQIHSWYIINKHVCGA